MEERHLVALGLIHVIFEEEAYLLRIKIFKVTTCPDEAEQFLKRELID